MNHSLLQEKLKDISVLYVEDDIKIRFYISGFLRRYTKQVIEASSAEEGLVEFDNNDIDIILLDINLPNKNGLEFARELRSAGKDVPIIISTAYTDKKFMLLAVELKLTRYLVKPLIGADILKALEKATDEIEQSKEEKRVAVDLGEGYIYDEKRKCVRYEGKEILLRRKEMELLEFFIKHSEETVIYDRLQYSVWEGIPMTKDAIRSQIRNLRKQTHKGIIKNITSIGYHLYTKEQ